MRRGVTDAIREILDAAWDPLTFAQIMRGLGEHDIVVTRDAVSSLLRQRVMAGEFIAGERDGAKTYTLNPEFVLDVSKTRRPRTGAKSKPAKKARSKPRPKARPAAAEPPPPPDALALVAMPARLAAIAADLEDAIGDACDTRLPHELIKMLTVASGATHRAARRLAD